MAGETATSIAAEEDFSVFLQRIRRNEPGAAEDFVRAYEPLIRREVRLSMEDHRLGRLFDSLDVSQSVLASFLLRSSEGQFDVDRPEKLIALLLTMARNKLASRARSERRRKRDVRRIVSYNLHEILGVESQDAEPCEVLIQQELWEQVQEHLSDEDRQLIELREAGKTWAQIAQTMGGTAQGRRMQLARSLHRVGEEISSTRPCVPK